jgi:hypothetical protein
MGELSNPRYPVYVISKGRWELRLTSKALDRMCVPYRVVIEPQERDFYAAVIDPAKLLILPFSNLGQGSIPARNWVWEHSISEGHERHWIIDDNVRRFCYFNRNMHYEAKDGATFRAMEDFTDRYLNVRLAGPCYEMFLPRKKPWHKPFYLNTRVYSCILIDNGCCHRWRGRYNEDTDLGLRILKDGDCTVQFCAFTAKKVETMKMQGGNTDELYQGDGRLEMARSLQRQHPDVVKIVRKWGRWQHQVDYRPFKKNRLIRKPGVVIPEGVNEYGMRLVRVAGPA